MYDNVQVRDTQITRDLGIAGTRGQIYGETTPSVVGVEVIGELTNDFALNVMLDGCDEPIWSVPELIDFLDHSSGTIIEIGNQRLQRQDDGSWKEID